MIMTKYERLREKINVKMTSYIKYRLSVLRARSWNPRDRPGGNIL